MPTPAYIRSGSATSFPSATDSREIEDEEAAGVRNTPARLLLAYLILLAVIAIGLLIFNLMLLHNLRMSPFRNGMEYLRFHKMFNPETGETEKVVHFKGDDIDLGSVLTNGKVYGFPHEDLEVYGSRVILSGEPNGTQLILDDTGCKLKNIENFQVISSENGRPMFSALHPMITIDKKIKKISTTKIVTNKVRSPVDEPLKITANDVSIRGNEGIRLEANKVAMAGKTSITLNTSRDGKIHLKGRTRIGTTGKSLPQSPSPAFSASVDAFRVCICSGPRAKIYLTPGNKKCIAGADICS